MIINFVELSTESGLRTEISVEEKLLIIELMKHYVMRITLPHLLNYDIDCVE